MSPPLEGDDNDDDDDAHIPAEADDVDAGKERTTTLEGDSIEMQMSARTQRTIMNFKCGWMLRSRCT